MASSLLTLLVRETKATIYATAIDIAETVGVNTSTWQPGDPTRSLFHLESELLAALEETVANFIASGFLDYATGTWLKVLAEQVYGVTVPAATFATTTVTLTNTAGGVYEDEDIRGLVFRNSTNDKTYRVESTPGTTLTALGTLDVVVVAEEAGSDSSAAAGEIDEMVVPLLGVDCTNATAAVGQDEQDESVTRAQCRAKLASLSPNGPKGAYEYVLRTPTLSGLPYVPRVRRYPDSDVGEVRIVIAGPSGPISAGDRDTAEEAVLTYATPLCITPVVESATAVVIPITYEVWLYQRANVTAEEAEEAIEARLEEVFADLPIGGDIIPPATSGKVYRSLIESTILSLFGDDAFRVSVSLPAGDTALSNDEVATLGTVTATISLVVDP